MVTLAHLIEWHRRTILADDANFDADGNCIDNDAAAVTFKAEQAALRAVMGYQCRTRRETLRKLRHLVADRINDRSTLIEWMEDDYLTADLLRSLLPARG